MAAYALLLPMDMRDEQRAWLAKVLELSGLAPTALAQKAGLAPTTLTRFLNNPEHATALSARTVSAVEKSTGLRFGEQARPATLRESEAEPFRVDSDLLSEMVRAAAAGANGIDPWRLRSRALEAAGYLPNDILIVNLNARPETGDVVCAQIYDWTRGRADTVFRVFEPPSLVSATLDPALRRPFFVDNESVVIRGVVVASVRPRQARAVA